MLLIQARLCLMSSCFSRLIDIVSVDSVAVVLDDVDTSACRLRRSRLLCELGGASLGA